MEPFVGSGQAVRAMTISKPGEAPPDAASEAAARPSPAPPDPFAYVGTCIVRPCGYASAVGPRCRWHASAEGFDSLDETARPKGKPQADKARPHRHAIDCAYDWCPVGEGADKARSDEERDAASGERGRAIALIRRYLLFDSQREVSWHEVQDCIDAIEAEE